MDLRPMMMHLLNHPLRLLAFLMLAGTACASMAQKAELIEGKETILARAREALAAELQPGTKLYAAVVKEKLIGRYTLHVSFHDKGEITSVFVANAEDNDIRSQNRFKELVRQCRLPFKTPKGRQYRVEQQFDLNALPH